MNKNIWKSVETVITKYKIHHILFWALYHLMWWSLFSESIVSILKNLTESYVFIKYSGYVIYQAIGVYFCLYVLIPKFLQKGKYVLFFISSISVIIIVAIGITTNYYVGAWIVNASVYKLFNVNPESPVTIFKYNALTSSAAALTLGMSIKLGKSWISSQKQQQQLEKEKLETELKFLKSQFNPHFLFNTINSIFVLIDKNTEMASETLVKFSNLLRYQLYECNENTIPLKKELAYIESFIELESLRQNENFSLQTNFPEIIKDDVYIAPFILVPFIENAFKHIAENENSEKWITLTIVLDQNKLRLEVANSMSLQYKNTLLNKDIYCGLGLKNVKRRLTIMYPNAFDLNIDEQENEYKVMLTLNL